MPEEKKKDPYSMIVEAMSKTPLTKEQFAKRYPILDEWRYSGASEEGRRKRFEALLGDPEMQKELRGFFDFRGFDFSEYEKPKKTDANFGSLENADIKDVERWYKRAKGAIDPYGRLGDTELYDTAGPGTFEQLERKIGANYDGDWFGVLLDEFGYPDNPKGYEQLTQDFQSALTRMKNKSFMGKFGKAEAPLRFMFGKTTEALDDGKKPGFGDIAVDTGTNALWLVSPTKFLPIAGKMASYGSKIVPKLAKVEELAAKANAPKTTLGEILKNVSVNGVAPTFNSFGDYVLGTDTEEEKRNGLLGRAINAAVGTGVNLAVPGYGEAAVSSIFGKLGRGGVSQETAGRIANSVGTFLNFGSRQEQAKALLAGLLNKKDFAKKTVLNFAKKLPKNKKVLDDTVLGEVAANLPGSFRASGKTLADIISGKGGNLGAGVKEYIKSNTNKLNESYWETVSKAPENIWDFMSPYISNYLLNRLGTDEFGGFLSKQLSEPVNHILGKDGK